MMAANVDLLRVEPPELAQQLLAAFHVGEIAFVVAEESPDGMQFSEGLRCVDSNYHRKRIRIRHGRRGRDADQNQQKHSHDSKPSVFRWSQSLMINRSCQGRRRWPRSFSPLLFGPLPDRANRPALRRWRNSYPGPSAAAENSA